VNGEDDGWLRSAMQHVLAELRDGGRPLVLTVIAMDGDDGLVQLTVSSRAPGRVYRKTIRPEEITGHDDGHT
jgi:hypothetical protein